MHLPIGLVYTDTGELALDPDRAIVEAIERVFATFRRLGSAMQTLKWFRKNAVSLPSRPQRMKGQVHWPAPNHGHIERMIRNPRYAGCFAYGRHRTRTRPDGTVQHVRVPMESWPVCIADAHVGFIDWDEYRRNQETLKRNVVAFTPGLARQPVPREGRALLQSRVICGYCGHRMRVRYVVARPKRAQPAHGYYYCPHNEIRLGERTCQSLRAGAIDAAVSDFIVAAVNRQNIALALAVREEIRANFAAVDRQHVNRIEALRHEADLARRRFMEVDPANRLAAAHLEAEWNTRLAALEQAIEGRERNSKSHDTMASAEQEQRLLELANDFGTVRRGSATGNADRKRLLALLIEDATLTREGKRARVGLRLRGGRVVTLGPVGLPKPRATVVRRHASDAALRELDHLLREGSDDARAAEQLNRRDHRNSRGDSFTQSSVHALRGRLRWPSGLEHQRERLRKRGYLGVAELADKLGIGPATLRARARRGSHGIVVCRFKVGKRSFCMYKSLAGDTEKSDNALKSRPGAGSQAQLSPQPEQIAV